METPPGVIANPQQVLDAFGDRVLELLRNEDLNRYTLGEFWNELVHERYVEKTKNPDLPTPKAWWHNTLGSHCEVRTAVRLGRIAKAFDAPALQSFGEVSLDDLIRLAHIKDIKLPRDPSNVPVPFTTPTGQKLVQPFSKCGLKEMEWALKSAKGATSRDDGDDDDLKEPTPKQAKWLEIAGRAVPQIVLVTSENDDRGDWVWDVVGIPPAQTREVLTGLLAAYEKFAQENGELK